MREKHKAGMLKATTYINGLAYYMIASCYIIMTPHNIRQYIVSLIVENMHGLAYSGTIAVR